MSVVAFDAVPLVMAAPPVEFDRYSPTLPACALSAAVVPLMPMALAGVISAVADRVVANTGSGVDDP